MLKIDLDDFSADQVIEIFSSPSNIEFLAENNLFNVPKA